jgi:hypothetical protein
MENQVNRLAPPIPYLVQQTMAYGSIALASPPPKIIHHPETNDEYRKRKRKRRFDPITGRSLLRRPLPLLMPRRTSESRNSDARALTTMAAWAVGLASRFERDTDLRSSRRSRPLRRWQRATNDLLQAAV